jgi:hypothetical protein
MKSLLKLEELLLFIFCAILASSLPYAWWWYWALFLTPDLGMIGYLVNPKVGAAAYNFLHHKGIAVACFLAGLWLANNDLQFTGLLLLGHSSFDRVFGYGLKYGDNFKNTHLGWIGGRAPQ